MQIVVNGWSSESQAHPDVLSSILVFFCFILTISLKNIHWSLINMNADDKNVFDKKNLEKSRYPEPWHLSCANRWMGKELAYDI